MSVLESIMSDLRELPESRLPQVAAYVKGLRPPTSAEREAGLKALAATAGCLSGPEGEEFERAVREEGERIDVDPAW